MLPFVSETGPSLRCPWDVGCGGLFRFSAAWLFATKDDITELEKRGSQVIAPVHAAGIRRNAKRLVLDDHLPAVDPKPPAASRSVSARDASPEPDPKSLR